MVVFMVLRFMDVQVFQHAEGIFESDVFMIVMASTMMESLVEVSNMRVVVTMSSGDIVEK